MIQLLMAPVLSVALGAVSVANALIFEAVRDSAGRNILFIRDCGTGGLPQDEGRLGTSTCEEWQESFAGERTYRARSGQPYRYPGDAAVLASHLRQTRYAEVWLFSGGGDLGEGVRMGRLFRQARVTVRVPNVVRVRGAMPWPKPENEVYCVSACTVAFMGGFFRYMDPDATYQVHSASKVAGTIDSTVVTKLARGELREIVERECVSGRYWAVSLFTYFQNTLLLPTSNPQRPEREDEYMAYAQRSMATLPYSADDEARDRERLSNEGLAAAQDMMMRIERDCMRSAINELRQRLGAREPRAEPALRMVEVMYNVSIKETATLTRETMLRMGYLTQDLESGVRP